MQRFSPQVETAVNWTLFLMALAWLALAGPARGQCITNGGNNLTVLASGPLGDVAVGDTLRAYSPRGQCVGQTVVPSDGGFAVSIAGDDQFTTPIDGMQAGEAWTLARVGPNAGALSATYENDITGAPVDPSYSADAILSFTGIEAVAGGAVSWPASAVNVPDTVFAVDLQGWAAGDTPIGLADVELSGPIDSVAVRGADAQNWALLSGGVQFVGMAGAVGGTGFLNDTTTVATVYGSSAEAVTLTITRADLVYATAAAAPAPTETPIASVTVTPATPGDLTGDFIVDAADYMLGIEYMLGLEDLTEEQRGRGDLSGDGTFDRRDVWLIFWTVRRSQ